MPNQGLATFYEPARFGRVQAARAVDNSCKFGAGALVSTAPDLVRFALALLNGNLLGSASLAQVFAVPGDATKSTYGLGWGTGQDSQGRRYYAHGGGAIGGRAALLVYPAEKVAVALLANLEGEPLLDEARDVASLYLSSARSGS